MARRQEQGFIWFSRDYTIHYKVKIDGKDRTDDIIRASFNKTLTDAVGSCEIEMYNPEGEYFNSKEPIEFYLDLKSGTALRWRGYVNSCKNKRSGSVSNRLKIKGEHLAGELLDITITESYENKKPSQILKDLIDGESLNQANDGNGYAQNFTYNNIDENSDDERVSVKWSNKPFWTAFKNLCNLVDWGGYIDDTKDFHFFERGSIVNTNEAIVYNDTMKKIKNLGSNTIDIKNRIIVYGQKNELPIIYTANDITSQENYGIKEEVIKDTDISTYEQAKSRAKAELALKSNLQEKGKARCYMLPSLNPGDMIWISWPSQHIHSKYEAYKFTHKIPKEETTVDIRGSVAIPKVFGKQKEKAMALENIVNPNKLTHSFSMSFEDESKISLLNSTKIDGEILRLTSGSDSGNMISNTIDTSNDVSKVQLKIVGNLLETSTFEVSCDNSENWKTIERDTLTDIDNQGSKLILKVNLNSDSDNPNPQIDELSLLYR